jgi:hypothetical protein
VLPQVNIHFRGAKTEGHAFDSGNFNVARLVERPKAFLFRNIASLWGIATLTDSNAANP